MKKTAWVISALLISSVAVAGEDDLYTDFKAMMDSSFKANGIADKHRIYQLDFQKACSQEKQPDKKTMQAIEAAQLNTIRYPKDGNFMGNWKEGEKIAISGRGLTWTDNTRNNNGGGCYNCHQMSHKEISFGTIGPTLQDWNRLRGATPEMVKYTWGKIYNAKAFNACSHMPRNGDAEILTEQQIKDVMAFLFDPESPVNKK